MGLPDHRLTCFRLLVWRTSNVICNNRYHTKAYSMQIPTPTWDPLWVNTVHSSICDVYICGNVYLFAKRSLYGRLIVILSPGYASSVANNGSKLVEKTVEERYGGASVRYRQVLATPAVKIMKESRWILTVDILGTMLSIPTAVRNAWAMLVHLQAKVATLS